VTGRLDAVALATCGRRPDLGPRRSVARVPPCHNSDGVPATEACGSGCAGNVVKTDFRVDTARPRPRNKRTRNMSTSDLNRINKRKTSSISRSRAYAAGLGACLLLSAFALSNFVPTTPFSRVVLLFVLALAITVFLVGFLKSTGVIKRRGVEIGGAAAIFIASAIVMTRLADKHISAEERTSQRATDFEREVAKRLENQKLEQRALLEAEAQSARIEYWTEIRSRMDILNSAVLTTTQAAHRLADQFGGGELHLRQVEADIKTEYRSLFNVLRVVLVSNPASISPTERIPYAHLNVKFQDIDLVTLANQAWRKRQPDVPIQDSTAILASLASRVTLSAKTAQDPFVLLAKPSASGRGIARSAPEESDPSVRRARDSERLRVGIQEINSSIQRAWEKFAAHQLLQVSAD